MSKIKIVTDSSITIEPDLLKELDITVVPLSVMVDGVVYSDNDLKEKGQFLELMKSGKALPKTSQPPVGFFADVYQGLQSQGADSIISIHICHSLSGTVEAARQGAMLSGVDVKIIDSGFTDQAMAFQVIEAAKLAQSGHSVEDILKEIDVIKGKTDLFIGVSTLENLIKGGRIGRVSGLLSSLLNIKVIMQMRDEKLHPIVKGRGQKTFTKWIDNFAEDITTVKVAKMAISYSGDDAFAKTLKEKFQPLLDCPITVLETGSIIQTHTGEDAFAVLICYA